MISILIKNQNMKEVQAFKGIVKELAARLTEEQWKIYDNTDFKTLEEFLGWHPVLDMSCYDVSPQGGVEELLQLRKEYEMMGLLLIADAKVSPLSYLRPGIRPDSLLLRPLTKEMVYQVMEEFISSCIKNNDDQDGKAFVIENKEGKTYIPYSDIFYFEAREKKIFIRTLNEEYGFYASLDSLLERLPDNFLRCHRSYIIDKTKIEKVISGQNRIILKQKFDIPLSRSYKSKIV